MSGLCGAGGAEALTGRVVADAAEVFGLLGSASRLRLLTGLLGGERCVHDLAAEAGLSQSAASHALRLLRARRVVSARRDGRHRWYLLDDAHVRMLVEQGLAHSAHTGSEQSEAGLGDGGRQAHRPSAPGGTTPVSEPRGNGRSGR
ncbi:ArsR/SmtB family transcription factor [Streptomyces sp.]|uniref:ArsR/SmtB family transcription factor n=1 Tax=Streptomyces sp. TaxID=1931 RepID=UPI002F415339